LATVFGYLARQSTHLPWIDDLFGILFGNRSPAGAFICGAELALQRTRSAMAEAYVIETAGQTAGIVVREQGGDWFSFHAAKRLFAALEGLGFISPRDAETAVRELISRGQCATRRAGHAKLNPSVAQ
jgi:hypothetical protein